MDTGKSMNSKHQEFTRGGSSSSDNPISRAPIDFRAPVAPPYLRASSVIDLGKDGCDLRIIQCGRELEIVLSEFQIMFGCAISLHDIWFLLLFSSSNAMCPVCYRQILPLPPSGLLCT